MTNNLYIARYIIETSSPLAVGTGKSGIDNRDAIARDFNGLPYIPGTGLAGVFRSLFTDFHYGLAKVEDIFGGEDDAYIKAQNSEYEKETMLGSAFVISDALLLDKNDEVQQELAELSDFQKKFAYLPKREHVRINEFGVAEEGGKFDTEVVFTGTRFKFEIRWQGNEPLVWDALKKIPFSPDFLLGSGTTNGYGQTKVIQAEELCIDLTTNFDTFLNFSTNLNAKLDGTKFEASPENSTWKPHANIVYKTNALHIGAGHGDTLTNAANYKEKVIVWNEKEDFKTFFVIPGTSVKGALAHRTAYYYNMSQIKNLKKHPENLVSDYRILKVLEIEKKFENFEKELNRIKNSTEPQKVREEKIIKLRQEIENFNPNSKFETNEFAGINNRAVAALFGFVNDETDDTAMGNITIGDVYIEETEVAETVFDHNAIDRFTGGTMNGALYSEQVISMKEPVIIQIKVKRGTDAKMLECLDKAIADLINGYLAIGGKTNKGYGFNQINA